MFYSSRRFVLCHLGIALQAKGTVLMIAADRGHSDCARVLLDAGADVNAKDSVRIRTCSATRCYRCCPFLFILVIFDFESTQQGKTALIRARSKKVRQEIIDLLTSKAK